MTAIHRGLSCKITRYISICLLPLVLYTCYAFSKPGQETDTLTKEQVAADFQQLTHIIEKGVPDPFYYSSLETYTAARSAAAAQLRSGMTIQELYRVLHPLIQCLQDAHFAIHLPDAWIEKEQPRYLPLTVYIENNRIYIATDKTPDTAVGTGQEILSINGMPARQILDTLNGTTYTHTPAQRFASGYLETVFHKRLYTILGFRDTFTITTPAGTYQLKGLPEEAATLQPLPALTFHLQNPTTGYLKINSLVWTTNEQRDSLKRFLDSSFTILHNHRIQNLILDIRGNLGGSSVLAKDILDYMATEPYTLATGVDYIHKGKTYHADLTELHAPAVKDLAFRGRVVLLSDALTYSSAHMMLAGFKYYRHGTTMGTVSSQGYYITGEIRKTILEHSGIALVAPTANFRLPGYTDNRPEHFSPDHILEPSLSERLAGQDIVLQKALDLLGKD